MNLTREKANKKIQLEDRHRIIVNNIIAKYPYQFYAYGSRVKGYAREFSDLDICYKEDIPILTLGEIQEDFENSTLPFKVDLVNLKWTSKSFQVSIEKDLTPI